MTPRRFLVLASPLTLIAPLAFAGKRAMAADAPLARWRWTSRLLLVFAPSGDDAALAEQRRDLAAHEGGGGERDLVVVEVVGGHATSSDGHAPDAAALRRAYGVAEGQFATILIGKDGGEKLRDGKPMPAGKLFAVIDRMPMRRDEAARK